MGAPTADEKTSHVVTTTDVPSTNLTPATTITVNERENNTAQTSMDLSRKSTLSAPSSSHQLKPFDADVEAGTQSCEALNSKSPSSQSRAVKGDCSVWPGKDHWQKKDRAAKLKNSRSCQCLASLEPRTKVIVKTLIALLIIGIACGVGIGISKPLGAPIWKNGSGTN